MHANETRNDFLRSYLATALWSSTGDDDEPLRDRDYTVDDFAPESIEQARQECEAFQEANATALKAVPPSPDGNSAEAHAGFLFWLNRNGHGTGFWDHTEWGEVEMAALHRASKAAGERYAYVGDDGRVWIAPE